MKKKLLIGILVGVLLVGSITAITLSTKEDAYVWFDNYKDTREASIDGAISEKAFTSDVECYIDYESESSMCHVCYEFKYNTEIYEDCTHVQEDMNLKDIEIQISEEIRNNINRYDQPEEVRYTALSTNALSIK